MSVLARINRAQFNTQWRVAGEYADYADGELTIENLKVIREPERHRESYAEDVITQTRATAFLISAADLAGNPSVGTQLTTLDGVFEVVPTDDGEPWAYTDAQQTRVRVQTIRVSDA